MASYEKISNEEVKRLAKQRDKDALYEMVWRFDELMPAKVRDIPVERCAWQDYWFEKAANAGHIDAKYSFAQSLINRVMNAEDRQKAMKYFLSLSDDFDADKLLNDDDRECGIIAKLRLGIMLCEGYHTQRDVRKGVNLINAADSLTNGFAVFGFETLFKLGELYATGLAQQGEEPSIDDLNKAIKYLYSAIKSFNLEKNDARKLDIAKDLLEIQEKRMKEKMVLKATTGKEETNFYGADERRRKIMELSDEAKQRMKADKDALVRLSQRLACEGWDNTVNSDISIKDGGLTTYPIAPQKVDLAVFSQIDCKEIFKSLENYLLELGNIQKEQKYELPSIIRIGSFKYNTENIPVMIPFEAMNGLCFETNNKSRGNALRQMQYIALSLRKQILPDVLKLKFVDIGLITSFPMLHSLNEHNIKFITDRDDLKSEIDDLFKTTRYISTKCLGGDYNNLREYNSQTDNKEPYNILFISNFPKEFNEEEINAICTLINEGSKCGIQVIMNLDKTFFPEIDNYNQKRFAKLFDISNQMACLDCKRYPKVSLNNFNDSVIQDFFNKYDFEFEEYPQKEINSLIATINKIDEKQSNLPENFLSILIGKSGRDDIYFELGEKADVYHALIAGASRSGKSTLMNNIITSIADKYSPDELRLFLLDYKEGVEFQIYENHPNVELLLLDNSNFAVGVETLTQFRNEINIRSKKFKDLSPTISNINEYNRKTSDKLPRMLMIIDEVQQLFTNYQNSREVNPLVRDIARLGGAFGIHLLFCSQSYVDSNIAADALSQMGLRISYRLSNGSECRAILGSDNDAPLRLERFQLVYNANFGRKDDNIIVKADNFEREKVISLLQIAAEKYKDSKPFEKKIIVNKDETEDTQRKQPDDNTQIVKAVESKEYKSKDYEKEFGF